MDQAKFWLDFEFKAVGQSDGSLILRGYAATHALDRDKEMFTPDAIKSALTGYLANPVLLLGHDSSKVIGKITSAVVDSIGVFVEAVVPEPPAGTEPWALKAFHDIKNGLYRAFSVGGLFGKQKGSGTISKMDWMETSIVSVPSNPTALFTVVQKAFNLKAMPAGATPVDSEDGDPPEGSYEDLIADLNRALMMMFPMPQCPCLLATFPDYCIVSVCEMPGMDAMGPMPMDMDYYRVAYTLDDMGEPVLGESVEVQRMYVPGSDGDDMGDGKAIDLAKLARKMAPLQSALTVDAVHAALLHRASRGPRTLPADNQQTLRAALAALDADFDAILAR